MYVLIALTAEIPADAEEENPEFARAKSLVVIKPEGAVESYTDEERVIRATDETVVPSKYTNA